MDKAAATQCKPCGYGHFMKEEGAVRCEQCGKGTFAEVEGTVECTPCKGTFTTLLLGAEDKAMCTCHPGKVWNRRDDVCQDCPEEAFCAGGFELPVVYGGRYGLHLGAVEPASLLKEQEDQKKAGTFVGAPGNYHSTEVYYCKAGICPAAGAAYSFDLGAFGGDAGVRHHTRPAAPLAGSCPENRIAVACNKCAPDYYGAAECDDCLGGAKVVSIIGVVIFPAFIVLMYKGVSGSGSLRVTGAFILVSTLGLGSFFMQTLAVMDTLKVGWPNLLTFTFEFARIFTFDLGGMGVTCIWGNDFAPRYTASICVPVYYLAATGVSFVASKMLGDDYRMQVDQTISMTGMVSGALYITLVKIVFDYYTCVEHPAAEDSLALYREVECGSDEHSQGFVPMLFGLIFYVMTFYGVSLWAVVVTPSRLNDQSFMNRFRFLLARWRPEVWYWGMIMTTRNLLIAATGLMTREAMSQLAFIMAIIMIAKVLASYYHPWRAEELNIADVATCFILSLVGMFGIMLICLGERIAIAERSGEATTDLEDRKLVYGWTVLVLMVAFGCTGLYIIAWALNFMRASVRNQYIKHVAEQEQDIVNALSELPNKADFKARTQEALNKCSAADLKQMKAFLDKVSSGADAKGEGGAVQA